MSGKSIQSQSTTTEGSCGLIYHSWDWYRFCNPPTFRSFDFYNLQFLKSLDYHKEWLKKTRNSLGILQEIFRGCFSDKSPTTQVHNYIKKLHSFHFITFYLWYFSNFLAGILSEKHMAAEVFNDFHEFAQLSRYVNTRPKFYPSLSLIGSWKLGGLLMK